ncbi:hypothetical protein LZ31DRAFT_140723 [Colletotrichum somersetense]|nr:hypothetical protein LZ31DRAFT_140723 [Colletotrichum somersetense]
MGGKTEGSLQVDMRVGLRFDDDRGATPLGSPEGVCHPRPQCHGHCLPLALARTWLLLASPYPVPKCAMPVSSSRPSQSVFEGLFGKGGRAQRSVEAARPSPRSWVDQNRRAACTAGFVTLCCREAKRAVGMRYVAVKDGSGNVAGEWQKGPIGSEGCWRAG